VFGKWDDRVLKLSKRTRKHGDEQSLEVG